MTNCVGISARFVTRLTKRVAETNRVAKRVGMTKRVGETKHIPTRPLLTEVYDINNIFELLSGDFCSYYSLLLLLLLFFFFFFSSFFSLSIFLDYYLKNLIMFIISLTCVLVTYLRFPLSPSLSPLPIPPKISVNQQRLQ